GGVYFDGSGSTVTVLDATFVANLADHFGLGAAGGAGASTSGKTSLAKNGANGINGNGMGGGFFTAGGTVVVGHNLIALTSAALGSAPPSGAHPGPDVHGTFSSLGNNMLSVLDGGASGFVGSDISTGVNASTLTLNVLSNTGGPTDTVSFNPGSVATA